MQQLATTNDRGARRQPLGIRAVVAAPPDVQTPDLAGAEPEPPGPHGDHQSGIGSRAAASVVAQRDAEAERTPLWRAFSGVPTGEVQQLGRLGRHR